MKLKRLEIFGFKSFADRTLIDFDQGVTCIVGPNGCGKSNISDSIRWVLGERSAKLLRGSKMEDVIFNGTDFRKPLGMAEVSLTIDNSDRGLPIEYAEVTLTRRLYRSGESEYLINKTLCRLKDIQDLILDTGIGSSSYSMIEQGRIDYILNADADERRFLIEEAAGISKYKVKKEEAIRKLERTEENRIRLNDIVSEVYKNIQYAERQARRAARYQELYDKLKNLEIRKAFYDLSCLTSEKTKLGETKNTHKDDLDGYESKAAELLAAQGVLSQNLRSILDRFSAEESKRYVIQSRMDQNAQLLQFHQEKRLEMASRRGQIAQEKTQLEARRIQSGLEIVSKQKEVETFGAQKEQAQELARRSEEALNELEIRLQQMKTDFENIKSESLEAASQTSMIRNDFHRLNVFLETSHEQKRHRLAGADRLKLEAQQWRNKKELCGEDLKNLEQKLQSLTLEKNRIKAETENIQTGLEALIRECAGLERSQHENQTRFKMLLELESAFRQNEEALLGEEEGFQKELVKTIRDILTVRSGFEWAFEAALDSFTRTLVADDLKTAETLLRRMQTKRPSSIGLLVRESDGSGTPEPEPSRFEHPKVLQALREIVEIRPGYEHLVQIFLRDTYVVSSLEPSEILTEFLPHTDRFKFVAENGVVLGPEGLIFYRDPHPSHEGSSLQRTSEIAQLKGAFEESESVLKAKRDEIKKAQEQLQILGVQLDGVESDLLDATLQKKSYDSLREGMEDRLGSYQQELELIGIETQQLETSQEDALAKKKRLEAELSVAEKKESELRLRQEALLRDLESIDHEKVDALKNCTETKVRLEGLEERSKMLVESLTVLAQSDRRDGDRIQGLELEVAAMEDKEIQLRENDERLRVEQGTLEEDRRQCEVSCELIRQEKEKAEKDLSDIRDSVEGLRKKQQEIQDHLHEFEMKVMDLGYQEKTIFERLQQTYRIKLSDFNPTDYPMGDLAVEVLEQEVLELRDRVEKLGAVNLLAIEEYEELKKRYEFLIAQQKDLDDARESLLETIRKINRTTKGLFEETFQNVQTCFQGYYQTLFRGGQARLVLLDETNPLESGIDIVVRPPGKKLTGITLLSGGEKALTAIALLFALFKIKPSPFSVLDEIDAPLDEANIDRFLAVLQDFLKQSQFLIVTHNRKTISMGDSLYGVTMQEPGVSKVVSVKVKEDLPVAQPSPDGENLEKLEDNTEIEAESIKI